MENSLEMMSFKLIALSGEARSDAMEALMFARDGKHENAIAKLAEARMKIGETHKVHADLIQGEAQGNKLDMNLLLIHAQDHFMTCSTMLELTEFILDMYKRIK